MYRLKANTKLTGTANVDYPELNVARNILSMTT